MFDRDLVNSILTQIQDALEKIRSRSENAESPAYFTDSPEGKEKLDGICMLFMAVGESLKKVDKITEGALFSSYPEIDWTGVMGFRDIIAHHYFDIDAEQVHWLISRELKPLSVVIGKMLKEIS